ncbi:MAG TPA: inositol phosphate phosphatase SopB [Limnobacter sp.]|nr:inositol phosphate phosphatase SopB [Limnobacter sp.]
MFAFWGKHLGDLAPRISGAASNQVNTFHSNATAESTPAFEDDEVYYDALESHEETPAEQPISSGVSTKDALQFKKLHIQASLKVLDDLAPELADHQPLLNSVREELTRKSTELDLQATAAPNTAPSEIKRTLGGKLKQAKPSDLRRVFHREQQGIIQHAQQGGEIPNHAKHLHFRTALAASICGKLHQTKHPSIDPTTLDQKIFKAYLDLLQSRPWRTIDRQQTLLFNHPSNNIQAVDFQTRMTPASALNAQFTQAYNASGLNGVCSYATTESRHAVNLWKTEFRPVAPSPNGTTYALTALRHGIHDAYGLKTSATERQRANDVRVKEFVHAAMLDHLERNGLTVETLSNAQPIELPMVSVNLVTTAGKEKDMAEQQQAAYDRINGQPMTLTLLDASGTERHIQVIPKIFGFKTPVNAWALGPVGQLLGIWRRADAQNKIALRNLMGSTKPGEPIGGEVARVLQRESNPQKIETIRTLVEQIRTIYSNKLHHNIGNEPYKLPVRLLALANECGLTPAFNCKSGKDRTGQLNVEIRDFYADLHANQGAPREVNKKRKDLARKNYQTLFLQGGDREIQALNTGVAGSKSQLPYYDKMMGVKPGSINNIKGISGWVGT